MVQNSPAISQGATKMLHKFPQTGLLVSRIAYVLDVRRLDSGDADFTEKTFR